MVSTGRLIKMSISKCIKCNNNVFIIVEKVVHEAETSETDKDLTAYRVRNHRIINIVCKKCKREYKISDFNNINFY